MSRKQGDDVTQFELMDRMVASGNGYICTAQAMAHGISKTVLADYVRRRDMDRAAHGIYISKDVWPDDLYLLSLSNKRIIFSHETALMLHGLTEHEPGFISVTVAPGYNGTHLRAKGVRIHYVKSDRIGLGVMEKETFFGNTVRVYDMDRTVCDIIRVKDSMDVQVFRYAIKEYMHSSQKNLDHLMKYAKEFHVEPAVRTYTEVLL